ncbi:MAG: helix-turn-helix transcriptional regulator [Proteobacteria bacterium]|nr:helix-turn-helix transcriptional regulator [Pseudomonadota bacterium]
MNHLKKSTDYQHVPRPVAAMADEYPAGYDARHHHRRAQLLYACSGVMSVVTDNSGFVVPPQRAVWLPSGIEHEVYYRARVSLRTLYIEPDAHPSLPTTCRVIEVSDLLRALILEAVNLPVEYALEGRSGHIMALILEEIATMPSVPLHAPIPQDERLARVCRAMFKDPVRAGTLEEWARAAGMSRRTLTRLFRQETGMSFVTWRQHMRLLEALSRLAIGHPVTRVALEVGYNSPSSFTAMFRRAFGTTPSHYFSQGTQTGEPDTSSHKS